MDSRAEIRPVEHRFDGWMTQVVVEVRRRESAVLLSVHENGRTGKRLIIQIRNLVGSSYKCRRRWDWIRKRCSRLVGATLVVRSCAGWAVRNDDIRCAWRYCAS